MKRIMAILVLVMTAGMLVGCAGGPMRTGKICVTPVTSAGYTTSDPIEIRPDIVQQVVIMLQAEIIAQLGQEKSLSYIEDCAAANFILTTNLKNLSAKTELQYRTIEREYTLKVMARLDSRDQKPIINNIVSKHANHDLSVVIKKCAGDVIDDIRKLP